MTKEMSAEKLPGLKENFGTYFKYGYSPQIKLHVQARVLRYL